MFLQLIGLVLLIRGKRAGCTVGIIGAALFAPLGLIGVRGFTYSRHRLDQLGPEFPASESDPAEVPLVRYAFENKSGRWYWVISIATIGNVYLYSGSWTLLKTSPLSSDCDSLW